MQKREDGNVVRVRIRRKQELPVRRNGQRHRPLAGRNRFGLPQWPGCQPVAGNAGKYGNCILIGLGHIGGFQFPARHSDIGHHVVGSSHTRGHHVIQAELPRSPVTSACGYAAPNSTLGNAPNYRLIRLQAQNGPRLEHGGLRCDREFVRASRSDRQRGRVRLCLVRHTGRHHVICSRRSRSCVQPRLGYRAAAAFLHAPRHASCGRTSHRELGCLIHFHGRSLGFDRDPDPVLAELHIQGGSRELQVRSPACGSVYRGKVARNQTEIQDVENRCCSA